MDKLEKFIIENKSNLNEPRHPEKGWSTIENRLQKKRVDFTIYWKVAAVLFFASTVGLLVWPIDNEKVAFVIDENETIRFEEFYVNQINMKMDEYKAIANRSESEDLFNDLVAFDSAYKELSKSFAEMRNQEIAEAMLENLRLRILILNEQIELVKRGGDEPIYYHSS